MLYDFLGPTTRRPGDRYVEAYLPDGGGRSRLECDTGREREGGRGRGRGCLLNGKRFPLHPSRLVIITIYGRLTLDSTPSGLPFAPIQYSRLPPPAEHPLGLWIG